MRRHACGYALAIRGHDTRAIQGWLGLVDHQHRGLHSALLAFAGSLKARMRHDPKPTLQNGKRLPRIGSPAASTDTATSVRRSRGRTERFAEIAAEFVNEAV